MPASSVHAICRNPYLLGVRLYCIGLNMIRNTSNRLKVVKNATIGSLFDRFCKKHLQFSKAYKIVDLSIFGMLIFFDYKGY